MSIVAVVGVGNGGLAVAGHLASRGHEVRVTDRNPEVLEPVAMLENRWGAPTTWGSTPLTTLG